MGRTLHVQTEDLGHDKSQILTTVYEKGHILFSKVSSYEEIMLNGEFDDPIHRKVVWHHSAIMKGIMSGKLDGKLDGSAEESSFKIQ
jgi:hypothetical protein